MAIYGLFSWIDYAIYYMVKFVTKLIVLVANYNFFGEDQISDLADKVYVILGVLVLFKIVISCVEYMVNPDSFDDKEKGMGGILKKTVICMGLLVVVRPVFSFALSIQQTVVATIPAIVLGNNDANYTIDAAHEGNSREKLENIGDLVAATTLRAFVTVRNVNGKPKIAVDPMDTTLDSFAENILNGCDKGGAISKYITTTQCDYDYKYLVSTAAGVFLLYILVSMIVDVGIRSIKLGIIQILAPIPIGSYIVSKEKFNKFVKLSVKVYLDLFIRLLVIYFIIFFVNTVVRSMTGTIEIRNGFNASVEEGLFIKVLIIIALFMFAKNAPKFICDVLGLDSGGFGDMKDMFTRGSGLLGATTAGIRTARSNYTSQKERAIGKGQTGWSARLAGLKGAAAGLGSATGRGLVMSAQGKGFKDVRQNATKAAIAARNKRNERLDKLYNNEKYVDEVDANGNYVLDANGNRQKVKNPEYYGYMDYRRDVRREKLGIPSSEGFKKTRYDAMEAIAKDASSAKGHGATKMNETPNKYKVSFRTKGGSFASDDYRVINAALGYEELTMEQVRNMYKMAQNGQAIENINGDRKELTAAQIDSLGSLVQSIEKRTSYLKEAELMATGDPAASPNIDKLILGITTNKDMFNAPEIMAPIVEKMEKNLANYRLSDNKTSPDYHKFKIGTEVYDMNGDNFKFNDLLELTRQLKIQLKEPKLNDQKYVAMKAAGKSDADINTVLAADVAAFKAAYSDNIKMRADILTGIKDSFEEVAKTQYMEAQIADNKAKKAQQAISNNNEKKG